MNFPFRRTTIIGVLAFHIYVYETVYVAEQTNKLYLSPQISRYTNQVEINKSEASKVEPGLFEPLSSDEKARMDRHYYRVADTRSQKY